MPGSFGGRLGDAAIGVRAISLRRHRTEVWSPESGV
jgi:hypothetical protein